MKKVVSLFIILMIFCVGSVSAENWYLIQEDQAGKIFIDLDGFSDTKEKDGKWIAVMRVAIASQGTDGKDILSISVQEARISPLMQNRYKIYEFPYEFQVRVTDRKFFDSEGELIRDETNLLTGEWSPLQKGTPLPLRYWYIQKVRAMGGTERNMEIRALGVEEEKTKEKK